MRDSGGVDGVVQDMKAIRVPLRVAAVGDFRRIGVGHDVGRVHGDDSDPRASARNPQ